jgi:hypothetical protein
MANFSNYLSIAVQKAITGQASYTAPSTVYLALCTSIPTASTPGTEAAYTGYARASLGATGADFPTPTTTSTANTTSVTFNPCTAGSSTVVAFQAYDALTGGNPLWFGTCSLSASSGITPSFAVGALTIGAV